MTPLVGKIPCTIDSKNRLMIPAEFRRILDQSGDAGKLYAVLHKDDILHLMPEAEFERQAGQIPQSRLPNAKQILFKRMFFSRSRVVEPDKQGRVVLPEEFVRKAKLGREVSVLGQGEHMEIHNRVDWEQFEETEDFNKLYDAMAEGEDNAVQS